MRIPYGPFLSVILAFCGLSGFAQDAVDAETLRSIESAQNAIRNEPQSELNRLRLASLYLKAGQNRSAVETLQAYLHTKPGTQKVMRLLAVAYVRQEEYAAAKSSAENALQSGQRDAETVEVLAMSQMGLGEIDHAEKLFREALRLDPSSVEANLQLGLLYTKQRNNFKEAIPLLEKARGLQPNLAGTYAALGSALLKTGDAKQAAGNMETAIKLAPDVADLYYVLASAYRQLHEDAKAEAALEAFNSRKSVEADRRAREMRCRASYEEGVNLLSNTIELDKAYALLSRAAGELPSFDPAFYRMAQISYLKGDLPRALASIREAIRLNPLEAEYYFVLARCLEDSDRAAALAAVEKAIGFRPGVSDFEDLFREIQGSVSKHP